MLIVAGDPGLRSRLAGLFRNSGHQIELAESVAQARRIALRGLARAVVVPEGLGPEGPVLAGELRAEAKLLLVTASSPEPGFDVLGASDEASLLAWAAEGRQPQPDDAALVLQFADYRLDLAGHSLTNGEGAEITLTPREFRLLREFVQRPGRVLSRDDLLAATAERDAESYDRSIDMLTMRLRRKIERDPKHPGLIATIPGTGYKFTAKVTKVVSMAPLGALAQVEVAEPPTGLPGKSERRHLTVLQCMLFDPSFLAAKHDPEDLHALITAFHEDCAQIVTKAGGTVARPLDDGVLACFGYPQADEDQAERAIRTALRLVETTGWIDASQLGRLHLRVGVASGLAVVGGQPTALGEAASVAAGLASRAEPDTVLIAASMRRLLGELFELRPCAPAEAWRVTAEAVAESRFEALHGATLAPLVGRE
ncbi:MAG: winged helix-turn-helix domain-containing protein, partial [Xanthobacteraceae bacterium]|nr:winged helix-turn-helix domain-containing protein [Xanthobacteraceae bacterium]